MRTFLLAALAASALWADDYPRQPAIDVQHYIFRVGLRDDSAGITGQTVVTVRFVEGVGRIFLDLGQPMEVTSVTSAGAAVPYRHQQGRLEISLQTPPRAGDVRTFTVDYNGVPAGGLAAVKNKYGERCFFSANWPDLARDWLPTVDHPSDKATGEFIVTAPARYQVVANGTLEETTDLGDGRRETHWNQKTPIATWLYNIGVAQFARRDFATAAGVPLQTWVYHQDRDAGMATLEEPTRQAMEFYSDRIGPYAYQKLAAVEAPISGGMEHASEIFYGEQSIGGRPAFGLVAHETAHQWFGDSVTEKDWDDVWLSEGFATYFALLAAEHYQGRDAFVAGLKRARDQVFATESRLPGVAVVQAKPWHGIPNNVVYQKGAWALHLLRGQVGTEKFWEGIREYYRRYRDANASTADFRRVMEEVSGQDLGWFFEQWLYRAGSPGIEGGWRYDAAARKVEIDLAQTQPGEPYRLFLEVAVGSRIEKLEMTARRQSFAIACDAEPASVTLDPETWMLAEARFTRLRQAAIAPGR